MSRAKRILEIMNSMIVGQGLNNKSDVSLKGSPGFKFGSGKTRRDRQAVVAQAKRGG